MTDMIVSRPDFRAIRKPVTPSYFFITLRGMLAARYGGPVLLERADERGELWSLAGWLVAIDILSDDAVGIIVMDGKHPDYRRITLNEAGLRTALEHVMELSSRAMS